MSHHDSYDLASANPVKLDELTGIVPAAGADPLALDIVRIDRGQTDDSVLGLVARWSTNRVRPRLVGATHWLRPGLGRAAFVGAVATVVVAVVAAGVAVPGTGPGEPVPGVVPAAPAETSSPNGATSDGADEAPRPVSNSEEVAAAVGVATAGDVPVSSNVPCTASGSSLREAQAVYGRSCTEPRVDCDPVDGSWLCSSEVIGASAPSPRPVPTTVPRGPCTASGSSLREARAAYGRSCTEPRVDCDQHDGGWLCSSETIGAVAPNDPPRPTSPPPSPPPTSPPPTNTTGPSTTTPATTAPPAGGGPFDPATDLISLHYDHAKDRDDGHATVAAREVTAVLGVNPHVVGGAYGENASAYVSASERVMDAAWGSAWVNANDDWGVAVSVTVDRWQAVLDAGGDVWIAEGGQSDLSADVVRQLKRRMAGLDTARRIHIVQHSNWNEDKTTDADLRYVKANTDYIKIADGNRDNATADLNQKDASFVSTARAGRHGSAWDAAFDYLDPDDKLDFSDTVELLHIVGVGKDRVADPAEFAELFIR